jgi:hypothetical protein
MVGVVEDQSRTEPEQATTRVVVDNLAVVLLGTEADNLRSMLVNAASLFSCRVSESSMSQVGRGEDFDKMQGGDPKNQKHRITYTLKKKLVDEWEGRRAQ